MVGAVVILAAVATSLLAAASLRLPSLVSTLLAAYLAFVTNLGLVTLVLSPFRDVTRTGLVASESVLLAAALVAWLRRGRPRPRLAGARTALAAVVSDRLVLLYLAAIVALLSYELALGLTVPPNNWDALNYHLAKVAAWAHHGGLYWIPNAPTDRINEFQPLAEQQLLFLFVATHRDVLYAIPQYLAELAILLGVFGISRRLGFETRAAACSAFLLATFTIVALEATTAQTDLVAASFAVVAAYLLLGSGDLEPALAGVATGLGVGAKLTTALVWPILVWLALLRGRRALTVATVSALAGFAAIGCWSFVLNAVHTGHLLGHGGGRVEYSASPSFPGSLVTGVSTLYEAMDLSILWPLPIHLLAVAGAIAAALAATYLFRRVGVRPALRQGIGVAVPFVAPVLVIAAGSVLALATRRLGTPVRGAGGTYGELNNSANEDISAFGPIGSVVLVAVPVLTAAAFFARKVDARQLAFACVLPCFLILLALGSKFDPYLMRFLIVPVALTAPLFPRILSGRLTTAAYLVVSLVLIGFAITRDTTKSLESPYGQPWGLTWVQALEEDGQPVPAASFAAFERAVPSSACVGAVLNDQSPSYLLSGRNFRRTVVYLARDKAVPEAEQAGVAYVVLSAGSEEHQAVVRFRAAGWRIRGLGQYWVLARKAHPSTATCT